MAKRIACWRLAAHRWHIKFLEFYRLKNEDDNLIMQSLPK